MTESVENVFVHGAFSSDFRHNYRRHFEPKGVRFHEATSVNFFKKKLDKCLMDIASYDNCLFYYAVRVGNLAIAEYISENTTKPLNYNRALKIVARKIWYERLGPMNDKEICNEMLDFLVKKGADVQCNNNYPIRAAFCFNAVENSRYLIEKGADVNTHDGILLFHCLKENNDTIKLFNLLIENSFDLGSYPETYHQKIWTKLPNDIAIVELFLEHGLNIYQVTDDYLTDIIKTNNRELLLVLKKYDDNIIIKMNGLHENILTKIKSDYQNLIKN